MMGLLTTRSSGGPMQKRVLAAAVSMLCITFSALAAEEHAAAFCKAILERVPATQEPCGKPPEGAGAGTVLVCAKAKVDFDAFSDAWDKGIAQLDSSNPRPKAASDWLT